VTIAIIDDDPDIIESISVVLTAKGFDVVAAKNIKDGENLIAEKNPDLIILDVMMEEPDDGFFLAQKLRKSGFGKPIVMLTSVSKTLGFQYGENEMVPVNKFLEKPISPAELIEAVKETLNKEEA